MSDSLNWVQIEKEIPIVKKEAEPIFSGANEMKFAPKTKGKLCSFFFSVLLFGIIQIRSFLLVIPVSEKNCNLWYRIKYCFFYSCCKHSIFRASIVLMCVHC